MVTDTQNTEKKRPAMEVKNVCFSYGKNEILKGASLKIEKGKVTTIMGCLLYTSDAADDASSV